MCHLAKGSCNPTRLLEAAELLEVDQRKQRKHEGGHSKETSFVLESTLFGSVPSRLVLYHVYHKMHQLEAVKLLEADQRKHEGGYSKAQGEAQAKLYMQTWSQTPDQPPLAAH